MTHTVRRPGARISLGLTLMAIALPGCGLARFTLGQDIAEQQIEGNPLGGLLGPLVLPIPLDVDLAAETAARGTGPAQHVYLGALTLSVTPTAEPAGDTDDLSFIDSIEIFVESSASGSSLPRQRVARLDPAPDGTRTLSIDPEPVDLIEYVREGARLTANASGTLPPDDVTYGGRVDLIVEVF